MKSYLLILSLLVLTLAQQPLEEKLDGGYQTTIFDPSNQYHEIALQKSQDAIEGQLQLSTSSYTFVKVVKMQTQVVSGFNYKINLLYTNDKGQKKIIQTIVWAQPWENSYQVTSVKELSAKMPTNFGLPKLPKLNNKLTYDDLLQQKAFQFADSNVQEKYGQELTGYTLSNGEILSTQLVAGMIYNYKLTYTSDQDTTLEFEVKVWEKIWENFYQIISITPLVGNRRFLSGEWTQKTINPTDPVDALALKALNDYTTQQTNLGMTDYKIEAISNAQTQLVAGTNYKLDIIYSDSQGDVKLVEAIVWVQPWINQADVTSFNTVNSFSQ